MRANGLATATIAVQSGRGERRPGSPLNVPPVLASAYRGGGEHGYSRDSNPTWEALEQALGDLDGGFATTFSSGMAAASAVCELFRSGTRVCVSKTAYVEVRELLADKARRGAIKLSEVDLASDPDAALNGGDVVWFDALSNPGLELADLGAICRASRNAGALSVVDATLLTPVLSRPLRCGADIVIHSATKQIGGHSDLLLGAAISADPGRAEALRAARAMTGSVPGTIEAWLALRGLRTLPLRIERAQASAAELARRLADSGLARRVSYPGIGTLIGFELDGGPARAEATCREVNVLTHATSLGGVETLIDRQSWHRDPSVPVDLLRISVGVEDPDDLWSDLEAAITASTRSAEAAPPVPTRTG